MMTDFLSLIFQLQLPLVIIAGADRQEGRAVIVSMLLCGAVLLTWWGGIRTVSRAGIRDPKRRGLFVALILPLTFVASLTFAPLVAVFCIGSLMQEPDLPRWLFPLCVLVLAVLWACRRAVDWILAEEDLASPSKSGGKEETGSV